MSKSNNPATFMYRLFGSLVSFNFVEHYSACAVLRGDRFTFNFDRVLERAVTSHRTPTSAGMFPDSVPVQPR